MYSLLLVAVELAVLGLVRGRWWLYGVGIVGMMYTHNAGVVYVALMPVVWYLSRIEGARFVPDLLRFVLWSGLGALLYAPWVLVAVGQAGAVGSGFWVQRPTLGALALVLHKLIWHTTPPGALGVSVAFMSGLLTICAGSILWGLPGEQNARDLRQVLIVLAFGPLLLAFVVSLLWSPVLIHRTMIGCAPFFALLLGVFFAEHRRGRWVAAALVPLLVVVLVWHYAAPGARKGDMDRFVAPVRADLVAGDAILHTSISSYVLISYYAPDLDHYLWKQANDLSQSLTDQTKDAMHMRQVDADTLIAERGRVWVFYSDSPVTSEAEIAENARIRASYPVQPVGVWRADLVESGVYLVRADHEK